jgi:hypothetical protein
MEWNWDISDGCHFAAFSGPDTKVAIFADYGTNENAGARN